MEKAKLLTLSHFLPHVKDDQMNDPYTEAAEFVKEHYAPHPVYNRYYATNEGRVYHITKKNHVTLMQYTKCMTQPGGKYGYPIITVYDKVLGRKTFTYHKFLWECWYKESPTAGFDIDHIDRDHFNNKKENLRLLSVHENRRWGRGKKYEIS